jgi:hypothetical protein
MSQINARVARCSSERGKASLYELLLLESAYLSRQCIKQNA